jgi:hypothetical protein
VWDESPVDFGGEVDRFRRTGKSSPPKSTIFDMIGASVGPDVFLTIKRRREKLLEYLEGRSRYPLQDSDAQTILLAISVGVSSKMAYKPLQFRESAEKVDSNVFDRDDCDGSPVRDRSLFCR